LNPTAIDRLFDRQILSDRPRTFALDFGFAAAPGLRGARIFQ
jgi:hypothetical protein